METYETWKEPGNVVGVILFTSLVLLVYLSSAIPSLRVNLARRRQGLRPIRWRDIRRSRLGPTALRGANDEELEADRRRFRQAEWERSLYYREIMVYGAPRTREFCEEHRRYCLSRGGPHPPGGHGNAEAPGDFDPDGAPLADLERRARARLRRRDG